MCWRFLPCCPSQAEVKGRNVYNAISAPVELGNLPDDMGKPRHETEVTEVIVIGAGLAGLACALRLKEKGIRCVVLEAKNIVGGRAGRGGAHFVHGEHVSTWRYIKRFGMQVDGRLNGWMQNAPGGAEVYVYVNGRLHDNNEVHSQPNRIFLSELEEMAEEWIGAGKEDIDLLTLAKDNCKTPMSDDEIRLMQMQMAEWNAADLSDIGVYDYDTVSPRIQAFAEREPDLVTDDGEELHWRIIGGHSGLTQKMAGELDVRLEHVVSKVDWQAEGVTVHCTNGKRFASKLAVITLPIACFSDVAFEPPLPSWKMQAAESLGWGVTTSVNLRFKERFWPEKMGFLFHPMSSQCFWPGNGHNVLTAFFGGAEANTELLPLSDAAMAQEILAQLETIFSKPCGGLQELFLGSEVIRWDADPYAKMAYSYCPVGTAPLRSSLRARCASLLWAGEATHPTRATYAHGALEEGERAAENAVGLLSATSTALVDTPAELQYNLVDLRFMESHRLDDVYNQLLKVHFPIEDELDDLEDMRSTLQPRADPRDPELHVLVARQGEQLIGCACYEYYPRSNFCLMSYICVGAQHRGLGVAGRLVSYLERDMQRRARETNRDLAAIFAETHVAGTEDAIMDTNLRQQVLRSLGFRSLRFDYTQPPLSDCHKPCGGLRLLVKDQTELPSSAVIAYLDDFAGSVEGWDSGGWRDEPYFKAQLAQLQTSTVEASADLPW